MEASDLKDKEHISIPRCAPCLAGCPENGQGLLYISLVLAFLKTHFIPSRGGVTELPKPHTVHPWSVLPPAVPTFWPALVGRLMNKTAG